MIENKKVKALVSLLNDGDKQIIDKIEKKVLSIGHPAIPYLEREWKNVLSSIVQHRIERIAHILQHKCVKKRLNK